MIFEIIVIGLLLIIAAYVVPFEIQFYVIVGITIILFIISSIIAIAMFIADPMGFLSSLVYDSPFTVFTTEMMKTSFEISSRIAGASP